MCARRIGIAILSIILTLLSPFPIHFQGPGPKGGPFVPSALPPPLSQILAFRQTAGAALQAYLQAHASAAPLAAWYGDGIAPGAVLVEVQPQSPTEAIAAIRQTCSGYSGPYPCYTSLAAWEAAYGGLPNGNLVSQNKIAVARIEGIWTQADTTPLNISGWTTDASRYIRIYTAPEARHRGTSGSGYRLATTTRPIYSTVAHFRIEGLEIHSLSSENPLYIRPGAGVAGDIRLSHNLIHGNGTNTGSGIQFYDYRCYCLSSDWSRRHVTQGQA